MEVVKRTKSSKPKGTWHHSYFPRVISLTIFSVEILTFISEGRKLLTRVGTYSSIPVTRIREQTLPTKVIVLIYIFNSLSHSFWKPKDLLEFKLCKICQMLPSMTWCLFLNTAHLCDTSGWTHMRITKNPVVSRKLQEKTVKFLESQLQK